MRNEDGTLPVMNFREAVSEIFWNWQLQSSMPFHHLQRDEEGIHVDKLYIGPTEAQYKMENWIVGPGVYEKLNRFLDVLLPMLEPLEEVPEEQQRAQGIQDAAAAVVKEMKAESDPAKRGKILGEFLSSKPKSD
jgi:hypothetical protein